MYVVTTDVFVTIIPEIHISDYTKYASCAYATLDMCTQVHVHVRTIVCVGLVDAHVLVIHVRLTISVSSRMPTICLFFLCSYLWCIVDILLHLHMCQYASISLYKYGPYLRKYNDMHSTSHHDCAVGNVISYHHIIHYSYINMLIKIEPTHLSPHNL